MNKKKIILLATILALLVLVGVLVFSLRDISDEKSSSYGLYGFNSYYVTDDFEIYFINQDGKKEFGLNEKLIVRQDCLGGPFIQYFIKEGDLKEYIKTSQETHVSTENPELFNFLYENDLIKKTKDACNPTHRFHINNENDDLIIARSLYKNDAEYDEALQLANKNFESYLDDLNVNCNECLLTMEYVDNGIAMGPYRYSTGELWDNFNYLCEIGPETLDNGWEIYPVNSVYSCQEGVNTCDYSANILGELFTADDCGENRIREIYGDSGNFHPLGLRINLADNPAQSFFLRTLRDIGFECLNLNKSPDGPIYDTCSELLLDKPVKVEDLLKLRMYYADNEFSMDQVHVDHIDYAKYDPQVIKSGQFLYVSNDLNLKFIYANPDPFFGDKCIISEKGNRIENSCKFSIEVIDKDPNISARDAIASLIPDMNYCDIETRGIITNFDSAYRIVPKEGAFSEDTFSNISVTCGKYVSFFSDYYDIFYNEDFPDRLLISNWGGHEPAGTLEKTDGPLSSWVHTVEFF